jgi:SAM-dependent methyltransferase
VTCILCAGRTDLLRCFPQSVTSEGNLIPAASGLYLCTTCGHLQTTVDVDLGLYYAEDYDAALTDEGHDEIVSTTDGRIVFRTDLDFEIMQRHLGDVLERFPSIFEFGCGRGRILSRLHKSGHRRMVAYDVSELYRDPISRFVEPDSIFIGQPPASGTFDLVISFFVLEHDVDPLRSLLYMRERLAPNGLLYLMVPSYVTNSVDLACADHVNHYSPRMLSELIEATGMRVSVVDDTSAMGGVVVVAASAPNGSAVAREDVHLASPERVAFSRKSSAEFLNYLARLEALVEGLRSERIVMYGAGFYGTLVQAHLEARALRVVDVFDANPRKQGTSRLGLTVRSPDALSTGEWSDADLVMCINPQIAASVGEKFAPYVRAVHVI